MTRKALFDAVRPFAPGGKLTGRHVTLIGAVADAFSLPDDPEVARRNDLTVGGAPDPELIAQLKIDEGLRLGAYRDTVGVWTIGYGHTGPEVKAGLTWTHEKAEQVLVQDVIEHNAELALELHWIDRLDPVRRRVLQNMAFNLGIGSATSGKGLLGFCNTLEHVRLGEWDRASAGMLASKWAGQVGERARRLARQMKTGA